MPTSNQRLRTNDGDIRLDVHFALLVNKGAQTLVARYSGSGDDGAIDSIILSKEPMPSESCMEASEQGEDRESDFEIPEQLRDRLERWIYANIQVSFNDEGGYGEMILDLRTMKGTAWEWSRSTVNAQDVALGDIRAQLPAPTPKLLDLLRQSGQARVDLEFGDDGEGDMYCQQAWWAGFEWQQDSAIGDPLVDEGNKWLESFELPCGEAGGRATVTFEIVGDVVTIVEAEHSATDWTFDEDNFGIEA